MAGSKSEGHFGLSGMRQRMAWLGGKLNMKSEPDKGTCITATVPWTAMQADEATSDAPSGEGLKSMSPNTDKK